MAALLLFNKPYGVLCQFSDDGSGKPTLKQFVDFPDVYPAGRLDTDSEGLLALTDSGPLQARLSQPKQKLEKTYWAQVEGVPDEAALLPLRRGVELKDGLTRPAKVRLIDEPRIWPRDPPIRFRKNSPTAWLEVKLSEGRNRQVRRMTAAVGFPTLRLVRAAIGPFSIDGIELGTWCEVSKDEVERRFPGAFRISAAQRGRKVASRGRRR